MKKTNKVAGILKGYAILNAVVGVIAGIGIGLDEDIGLILLAASVVVSFGVYAFGEMIQLLEDIKNNTSKENEKVDNDEIPDI